MIVTEAPLTTVSLPHQQCLWVGTQHPTKHNVPLLYQRQCPYTVCTAQKHNYKHFKDNGKWQSLLAARKMIVLRELTGEGKSWQMEHCKTSLLHSATKAQQNLNAATSVVHKVFCQHCY